MSEPESKKFYITTTLPYMNASLHIGHALECVRADAIARYYKLNRYEVFFNTGSDEHGQKILQKAREEHKDPLAYVNQYVSAFKDLLPLLGVSLDVHFTRTTAPYHIHAAQEFWKRCDANGFIYKKNYQIKYCVGCELEKAESELVDGKCPIHPTLPLELIDEENYFFRFSAFADQLLSLYQEHPTLVIPQHRLHEIESFVKRGLHDFSISRLKSKMSWGIDVPGDPEQVMYVWFDALVNYIAAIGWPDDLNQFQKWQKDTGGMVQYCGKDNLRQQAAMWQAMLMAAELPNSKTIIIDGFVTGEGGVKMSKTAGNGVDPVALIREYGTDAFRYYVLRELNSFEDSVCTNEYFRDAYNANLANGLGNLVSRIMTMAQNTLKKPIVLTDTPLQDDFQDACKRYDLQDAMNIVWRHIGELDASIQETQPFKLIRTNPERAEEIIQELVSKLYVIARHLEPLLPDTSHAIQELIRKNAKPEKPLFLRKE